MEKITEHSDPGNMSNDNENVPEPKKYSSLLEKYQRRSIQWKSISWLQLSQKKTKSVGRIVGVKKRKNRIIKTEPKDDVAEIVPKTEPSELTKQDSLVEEHQIRKCSLRSTTMECAVPNCGLIKSHNVFVAQIGSWSNLKPRDILVCERHRDVFDPDTYHHLSKFGEVISLRNGPFLIGESDANASNKESLSAKCGTKRGLEGSNSCLTVIPKRKRGRPPKQPQEKCVTIKSASAFTDNNEVIPNVPMKRKRGRPFKQTVNNAGTSVPVSSTSSIEDVQKDLVQTGKLSDVTSADKDSNEDHPLSPQFSTVPSQCSNSLLKDSCCFTGCKSTDTESVKFGEGPDFEYLLACSQHRRFFKTVQDIESQPSKDPVSSPFNNQSKRAEIPVQRIKPFILQNKSFDEQSTPDLEVSRKETCGDGSKVNSSKLPSYTIVISQLPQKTNASNQNIKFSLVENFPAAKLTNQPPKRTPHVPQNSRSSNVSQKTAAIPFRSSVHLRLKKTPALKELRLPQVDNLNKLTLRHHIAQPSVVNQAPTQQKFNLIIPTKPHKDASHPLNKLVQFVSTNEKIPVKDPILQNPERKVVEPKLTVRQQFVQGAHGKLLLKSLNALPVVNKLQTTSETLQSKQSINTTPIVKSAILQSKVVMSPNSVDAISSYQKTLPITLQHQNFLTQLENSHKKLINIGSVNWKKSKITQVDGSGEQRTVSNTPVLSTPSVLTISASKSLPSTSTSNSFLSMINSPFELEFAKQMTLNTTIDLTESPTKKKNFNQ